MKNRLAVICLLILAAIASTLSLGAGNCGSDSEETATTKIATVDDMWGDSFYDRLTVVLKPTSAAQADQRYVVELYEKGKFRDSTGVSWNQPQINVHEKTYVDFSLSAEEADAYGAPNVLFGELSKVFSIKVRER